jgi:hypothetical protein
MRHKNDPLLAIPPYGWRYRPMAPARANAEQQSLVRLHQSRLEIPARRGSRCRDGAAQSGVLRQARLGPIPEVVEANQQIVRLATAQALIERINVKHAAKLAPDTLLTLRRADPAHSRRRREPVSKLFRANGMPGCRLRRAAYDASPRGERFIPAEQPASI